MMAISKYPSVRLAIVTAAEDQVLTENLALLEGYASALLSLDEEAAGLDPVNESLGSQLNLAWRRLMARALRG